MAINYYLKKLVGDSPAAGKYVAQMRVGDIISLQDLIDAVAEAKTGIGRGDIASVIELMCEIVEREIIRGSVVHLGGIVRLWATIKGTFDDKTAPYDPTLHSLNIASAPNSRAQRALRVEGIVERVTKMVHTPQLDQFGNITAGVDTEIGTFCMCQLDGEDMDFDSTDSTQGLFVVDTSGSGGPDVKVSAFQKATNKQIVFQSPDLTGYTEVALQVRRRQTPDGDLLTGNYNGLYVINPPVMVEA